MDFQSHYFPPPSYLSPAVGVGSPVMGNHYEFHRSSSTLQHGSLNGAQSDPYTAHLNHLNSFQQALSQGGLTSAPHSSNSYMPYNFGCTGVSDRTLFGRYCYGTGSDPLSAMYDMKNYNGLQHRSPTEILHHMLAHTQNQGQSQNQNNKSSNSSGSNPPTMHSGSTSCGGCAAHLPEQSNNNPLGSGCNSASSHMTANSSPGSIPPDCADNKLLVCQVHSHFLLLNLGLKEFEPIAFDQFLL